MKDARDPGTIDMTLVPKRGRGRPSTGNAKSAAERMREYRSRSVTVNRTVLESALVDLSAGDKGNVTEIARLESDRINDLNDRRNAAFVRVDSAAVYLTLLDNCLGALDDDARAYMDALSRGLAEAKALLA